MKPLPNWSLYALGAAIVGVVGYSISIAPSVGAPLPPSPDGGPRRLLPFSAPIVVAAGRTYFVTLTTHGVLNAAGADDVKSRAEAEGFRDVVVSKVRIKDWPPLSSGDYFARATFVGKVPRTFPRHASVPLGSVDVVDVWEA